jgi:hypothetical protein
VKSGLERIEKRLSLRNGMRLYLFDNRTFNVVRRSLLASSQADGLVRVTGPGESLRTVLDDVRRRVNGRALAGLRLCAHGDSGRVQFSANGVDRANVSSFAALRGRIRGHVEIHGCGVASATQLRIYTTVELNIAQQRATPGTLNNPWLNTGQSLGDALRQQEIDGANARSIRQGAGVQFLIAFANAIHLPVTGAVHAQLPDAGWQYEGPTITAWPGGALRLHVPDGDETFGPNSAGDYAIGY